MSSILNDSLSQPAHIVEHPPLGYNCTGGDEPNQWIAINLLEGKLFHPTGYTLRSSQIHQLSHWEFQGKRSETSAWITLHKYDLPLETMSKSPLNHPSLLTQEQTGNEALGIKLSLNSLTSNLSPYSEGYFGLGIVSEKYQLFRIVMTGPNTENTNHLFCSGLELYGTLYY